MRHGRCELWFNGLNRDPIQSTSSRRSRHSINKRGDCDCNEGELFISAEEVLDAAIRNLFLRTFGMNIQRTSLEVRYI